MLHSLRVKDYMTRDHLTFRPELEALKAIHQLVEHELSGAPVVDPQGRILGFFSEKDGLKVALHASYYEEPAGPVSQFMVRDVRVIDADSSLADAAELFLASTFRCYPVVEDGLFIGQIARNNVLRALEKLW